MNYDNITLPDNMLDALQKFATAHGKNWKKVLNEVYWYNARIWRDGDGKQRNELHELRNWLGPDWLDQFKGVKP